MCFTPAASLLTASIEFLIAGYLWYRIKDKRLYPIAIFVFLLGVYQLTEFMLCTTSNQIFWARIGFAAYTFMPILLYHFFISASGKRIKYYLYTIPVLFSVLALFHPQFIAYTSCNSLHVTVESMVFNQNLLLMILYLLYYLICPVYGVYVFSKSLKPPYSNLKTKLGVVAAPFALLTALLYYVWSTIVEQNQVQTWLHTATLILISTLLLILLASFLYRKSSKLFFLTNSLILVTTIISITTLYYVIPNLTLNYASIFCQFALLYGLAALLLIIALDGRVCE